MNAQEFPVDVDTSTISRKSPPEMVMGYMLSRLHSRNGQGAAQIVGCRNQHQIHRFIRQKILQAVVHKNIPGLGIPPPSLPNVPNTSDLRIILGFQLIQMLGAHAIVIGVQYTIKRTVNGVDFRILGMKTGNRTSLARLPNTGAGIHSLPNRMAGVNVHTTLRPHRFPQFQQGLGVVNTKAGVKLQRNLVNAMFLGKGRLLLPKGNQPLPPLVLQVSERSSGQGQAPQLGVSSDPPPRQPEKVFTTGSTSFSARRIALSQSFSY